MIQNIGQKLKAIRLTHCVSQKIVADHLGISVPGYSKIETGLTDISFNKLLQIADIYQVSIVDILQIGEKDPKEQDYPDLRRQLTDLKEKYNEQLKKMIELYEIIREYKTETVKI
jgi:transcriptional regulator with XRE-family HTH domain